MPARKTYTLSELVTQCELRAAKQKIAAANIQ